jgi:four helix bundle protein
MTIRRLADYGFVHVIDSLSSAWLTPELDVGSTGPARFVAYELSLELVSAVRLASSSWRNVGDLDQGRRASISIALNLREGSAYPSGSPSRRRFFDITHASAFEVEAVLDIARSCGFDDRADRAASLLAGRVAAMTTVLVRRQ